MKTIDMVREALQRAGKGLKCPTAKIRGMVRTAKRLRRQGHNPRAFITRVVMSA